MKGAIAADLKHVQEVAGHSQLAAAHGSQASAQTGSHPQPPSHSASTARGQQPTFSPLRPVSGATVTTTASSSSSSTSSSSIVQHQQALGAHASSNSAIQQRTQAPLHFQEKLSTSNTTMQAPSVSLTRSSTLLGHDMQQQRSICASRSTSPSKKRQAEAGLPPLEELCNGDSVPETVISVHPPTTSNGTTHGTAYCVQANSDPQLSRTAPPPCSLAPTSQAQGSLGAGSSAKATPAHLAIMLPAPRASTATTMGRRVVATEAAATAAANDAVAMASAFQDRVASGSWGMEGHHMPPVSLPSPP